MRDGHVPRCSQAPSKNRNVSLDSALSRAKHLHSSHVFRRFIPDSGHPKSDRAPRSIPAEDRDDRSDQLKSDLAEVYSDRPDRSTQTLCECRRHYYERRQSAVGRLSSPNRPGRRPGQDLGEGNVVRSSIGYRIDLLRYHSNWLLGVHLFFLCLIGLSRGIDEITRTACIAWRNDKT